MRLLRLMNIAILILTMFLGYQLTQFYRQVRLKVGVVQTSKEWEHILLQYNLIWLLVGLIFIGLIIMIIITSRKRVTTKE